jgi:hypothetical protein
MLRLRQEFAMNRGRRCQPRGPEVLEPLGQPHAIIDTWARDASTAHERRCDSAQAVNVKQWHHAQRSVSRCQLERLSDGRGCRRKVCVSEQHEPGFTRRPRGIQRQRNVIAVRPSLRPQPDVICRSGWTEA